MSENHFVVLFHTSNHAFRAESVLRKASIPCKLTPVPRHLSSDCGVCAQVSIEHREGIESILADGRVEVAALHDI